MQVWRLFSGILSPSIWGILEDSRESAQSHDASVLLNICAHWSAGYLTHVMPVHRVVTIPKHGYCPVVWQHFSWEDTTHSPQKGIYPMTDQSKDIPPNPTWTNEYYWGYLHEWGVPAREWTTPKQPHRKIFTHPVLRMAPSNHLDTACVYSSLILPEVLRQTIVGTKLHMNVWHYQSFFTWGNVNSQQVRS